MGVALLQPGYLVFKIPEIFAYELCRKAYINCTDLQYDTDIHRYEQVRGAIHLAWLYLLCAGIQWHELVEWQRIHAAVLTVALATLDTMHAGLGAADLRGGCMLDHRARGHLRHAAPRLRPRPRME